MFDEGPPDNEDLQWDLHQAKAEIERLQKENDSLRQQLSAATPSLPYTPVTNGDLRLIRDQALRIQKLEAENRSNLTQAAKLASYAMHTFLQDVEGIIRNSLPATTKVDMLRKRMEEVRDALKRRTPIPEVKNELNPDNEPAAPVSGT